MSFFQQCQGNSSESFFEWGIVGDFDYMFSQVSTAKFTGSGEKTSWYSAKRDKVESTSVGGQDSSPLKSNSSNNFSCLCFMVSFDIRRPCAPSTTSITLVCIWDTGTHVTATALTTGVFFLRVWGYVYCISDYHSDVPAAIVQLHVSVLHCQALG